MDLRLGKANSYAGVIVAKDEVGKKFDVSMAVTKNVAVATSDLGDPLETPHRKCPLHNPVSSVFVQGKDGYTDLVHPDPSYYAIMVSRLI